MSEFSRRGFAEGLLKYQFIAAIVGMLQADASTAAEAGQENLHTPEQSDLSQLRKQLLGQLPNSVELSSVSRLRAMAGAKTGQVAVVLGYNQPGDGGGGLFYADTADSASTDNNGTTFVDSTKTRWKRIATGESVNVKWFGAVGDGKKDDTAAIQSALNYYNNTTDVYRTGTVYSPPGRYKISATITIDTYRTSLIADSLWDASSIASGPILKVVASVGAEGGNSYGRKGKIEGLRISGGQIKAGVIGVDFDSPNAASNAAMLMTRCAVSAVGTGIRHANRAYNGTILQCEIFNCSIGVACPSGLSDYGERMTYVSCVIYNSGLAVSMGNSNGAFFFSECSFDYNTRLFNVQAGQIVCTACHFESSLYKDTPIVVASGVINFVRIIGGYFMTQGTKGAQVPPYIVEVGAGSEVHFDDVALGYSRTSTEYFCSGSGRCYVRNKWIASTHENPRLMQPESSFMADGSFEGTEIVDPIWLSADTRPVTDRHTGANARLAITGEAAHSGKKSLKFSKLSGAGSLSSFVLIMLPVNQHQRIGWVFWHRLSSSRRGASSTYQLFYALYWAKIMGLNQNRIPFIEYQVQFNSGPFDTKPNWERILSTSSSASITPPQWSNYFLLEINGVNVNAADVLFDDVQAWAI